MEICSMLFFIARKCQPEIWPQRPTYFAAVIAMHYIGGGGWVGGGGISVERVACPWGGGLTFVLNYLMANGKG